METKGLKRANQRIDHFLWAGRVLRLRENVNHQAHVLEFD